jgi:hypothetical protein
VSPRGRKRRSWCAGALAAEAASISVRSAFLTAVPHRESVCKVAGSSSSSPAAALCCCSSAAASKPRRTEQMPVELRQGLLGQANGRSETLLEARFPHEQRSGPGSSRLRHHQRRYLHHAAVPVLERPAGLRRSLRLVHHFDALGPVAKLPAQRGHALRDVFLGDAQARGDLSRRVSERDRESDRPQGLPARLRQACPVH